MKNFIIAIVVITGMLFLSLFVSQKAQALDLSAVTSTFSSALFRPFGGKIRTTNVPPNVTCPAGTGPTIITPVGTYPAGPYVFQHLGNKTLGNTVKTNSSFLGNYTQKMAECVEVDGPEEHPYSVYITNFYGVSKY